MLIYDRQSRCWSFSVPGCTVSSWRMGVEVDGALLGCERAQVTAIDSFTFELLFPDARLTWMVACEWDDASGCLLVRSELRNDADQPVVLGKVFLLETDRPIHLGASGKGGICPWKHQALLRRAAPSATLRVLRESTPYDRVPRAANGPSGKDLVCLPLSGDLGDRRVYALGDPDCPRRSKVKVQFYDRSWGMALQAGFVTFQRANTEVGYDYHPEVGLSGMRAWCDFAGWRLGAGCSTPIETFCLMAGDDPYAQLARWADLAASRCAPRRWTDAPIGWVGWAWVDPFTVERYEEVVLRNCEAIRRRLRGFGVEYVWISIGNLAGGTPGDWLRWNDALFPSGPQALAARLREMGFRWGLWCGVFWVCSSAGQLERLREALLKDADGSPMVVRPEWQFGDAGALPRSERPCIYALDPSHPEALAYLREVFETYRRWGVRYYMLDFLEAGAGNISRYPYADYHDRRLVAGPEVYHNALRVVREAAGDDTYFLSSTGPSVHNAGAMDAIRTGTDFGEGRPLYPDSYFYPATYVINNRGFWTGPLRALLNQAAAYYSHRKLYMNDSGNVLTVDKPLPLNDAQIHATIHALSGGPTMLGDDVERIDEERLRLVKATLPRSREVAVPVDLFESVAPDHPKVFHRQVVKPWGRFDVVAVYNLGDEPLHMPVALSKLGLDAGADSEYLAWEFWNGEYVGRAREVLKAQVPPGTVKVYRLARDEGRPVLLGTDMHLLMGEMEIVDCEWEPEALTLRGTAIRPAGESGNLFVYVPAHLRVADSSGLWVAKDAREGTLIVRVALRFEGGPAAWRIRLSRRDGQEGN